LGLLPNHYNNFPDGVPEKPWYTIFPPAELVPMHDAVFSEDMQPELLDPKPEPKRIKRWWDEDVLRNEEENTLKDYNAKFRAEWLVKKWKEAEIKNKNLYMKNVSDYSYIA